MDKKLKFQNQENAEFIKELREKVNRYFEIKKISKYGNTGLVLKSVFMLMLYYAPFIFMLTGLAQALPVLFAGWIVMGVGMAGIGMGIMHDANHHTFSKHRSINRILGGTLFLLGGFPATWRYQHNTLHHGFTNIDDHDEDIDPGGFLRLSPHKPLYRIHKVQYLYAWILYGLMTIFWITFKDFMQFVRYTKSGASFGGTRTRAQLLTILIVTKILYYLLMLVLPVLILPFSWYWIILSFLLMHFVSGLILGTVFQTAHVVPITAYPLPDQDGMMGDSWVLHQLKTTADFSPGNKLLTWFIGGLNYQVEHHLFPHISHVHYRGISSIVKETALKFGLPYHVQPSFVRAISEHVRMLKTLGANL